MLTILAAILIFGCERQHPSEEIGKVSSEVAYRCIAGLKTPESIPIGVTDFQSSGVCFMDYIICCRFIATEAIIENILVTGYSPTDWDSIEEYMYPEDFTDDFRPSWTPENIQSMKCYIREVQQAEGIVDMSYLVIDSESGLVYAVSESWLD